MILLANKLKTSVNSIQVETVYQSVLGLQNEVQRLPPGRRANSFSKSFAMADLLFQAAKYLIQELDRILNDNSIEQDNRDNPLLLFLGETYSLVAEKHRLDVDDVSMHISCQFC